MEIRLSIAKQLPHVDENFVFVSDMGNHRILILNATETGTLQYYDEYRTEPVEMNQPESISIFAPGFEMRYQPTYANVFVADRMNHRLLKLDFGYYFRRVKFHHCHLFNLVQVRSNFKFRPESNAW